MSDQKYIEAELAQQYGRSEDHAKWLNEQNAQFADWYATCPVCGQRITGTMEQLKAHSHAPES